MLTQKISRPPSPDPPQPLHRYRENFASQDREIVVSVAPGTIELQWTPAGADSPYWFDGCYCDGELSAVCEAVYSQGEAIENSAFEILLPPWSSGQLAYRSKKEIPQPTIEER